ncbi:hypothetical protein [Sphingobium yanoikuyae]|uniref:hypothetical protein n=1 Tax=Sphingobium yanoikuyae TaxID=13690 RepID=UPI00345E0898
MGANTVLDALTDAGLGADRLGPALVAQIGPALDGGVLSLTAMGALKATPLIVRLLDSDAIDSNHKLLKLVRQAKWEACRQIAEDVVASHRLSPSHARHQDLHTLLRRLVASRPMNAVNARSQGGQGPLSGEVRNSVTRSN